MLAEDWKLSWPEANSRLSLSKLSMLSEEPTYIISLPVLRLMLTVDGLTIILFGVTEKWWAATAQGSLF